MKNYYPAALSIVLNRHIYIDSINNPVYIYIRIRILYIYTHCIEGFRQDQLIYLLRVIWLFPESLLRMTLTSDNQT